MIRCADDETPVLLFVDEGMSGVAGKLHRKHVETCLSADAVVCSNRPAAERLLAVDGMPSVSVIEPGLRYELPSGIEKQRSQQEIRAALARAHPILRVDQGQPLVVTACRMDQENDLKTLVRAWPLVLKQYPGAKLWVLGQGKNTGKIWHSIVEHDISYSAVLPGYFDELNDIFCAADVYVEPCGQDQLGDGLTRALTAGLCSIATRNPWTAEWIESSVNGLLVPTNDCEAMAKSILYAISNESWRLEVGRESKNQFAKRFRPAEQAKQYAELVFNLSGQMVETAK